MGTGHGKLFENGEQCGLTHDPTGYHLRPALQHPWGAEERGWVLGLGNCITKVQSAP